MSLDQRNEIEQRIAMDAERAAALEEQSAEPPEPVEEVDPEAPPSVLDSNAETVTQ